MDKIHFKLHETETDHPKEVIEAFLCLYEDYVEYKVDYYLDEKDESLGWVEDKYVFYDQYASKEAVKGVNIAYKHKHNKWAVTLHLLGFTEDIWVNFNDEQKAKELFNKILDWKYKKK